LSLLGRPLLHHTLAALVACPEIDRVWVVLSPDDGEWDRYDWSELGPKLETLRCGGTTRADSVGNGLRAAAMVAADDDWILVHDAVRPCLSREMLATLLGELVDDKVGGQAQTPQMFRYGVLKEALEKCSAVTDESGAIEALGLRPRLVRADATNLKVTYPADLVLAALILRGRK